MDSIEFALYPSSIGTILLVARKGVLARLDVRREGEHELRKAVQLEYPHGNQSDKPFRRVAFFLDKYLKGEMVDFAIEVDLSGMTPFIREVLTRVKEIPYGETRSYKGVGEELGLMNAARAVGQAVKRNPIPIVIPCHRVIREDGSPGGFSLKCVSKEYLLNLEGALRK